MPPELPKALRKNEFPMVTITVDDRDYVLPLAEVTSNIAKEIRKASGRSLQKVIAEVQEDPDIDTIAVLVFAARRLAGEHVTLDEVEATISYGSDFGFASDGEEIEAGEVHAAS